MAYRPRLMEPMVAQKRRENHKKNCTQLIATALTMNTLTIPWSEHQKM
jgi:hypothetical protein